MDNENEGELAVPGTSGVKSKRNKSPTRRARSASSSSNTSSSSSSSSSSESSRDSKKKKKRRRRRRSKKQKREHQLLEKLSKEVGELRKNIANYDNNNYRDNDVESFVSDVSRDLYNDCASQSFPCQNTLNADERPNLSFNFETKIKDPVLPSTPPVYMKMLDEVQRFGSSTWSDVRYAETQKLYNHSPGFTELDTNEEVKAYDNLRHLSYSEKSYAALTFCVLKQKEVFLDSCRALISWSLASDSSLNNLNDKVDEIFLKGDFHKVSTDLLQMVCGHRAEAVEMKRDNILKSVRDPILKCKLNKIPPSNTHLFHAETLTSTLDHAGGVRKAFWPINQANKGNASRAKPNNPTRLPSQGHASQYVPSRGTQSCCDAAPSTYASNCCHHNQASQGFSRNNVQKGHTVVNHDRPSYHPNRGSSFRSRGSRLRHSSQRGQKRHFSPSDYRGNKRQKQ